MKCTIHHWDTFDNETIQIDTANSVGEAEKKIALRYKDRLNEEHGADRVEIRDLKGNIIRSYGVQ